jgi:hypothetical protein
VLRLLNVPRVSVQIELQCAVVHHATSCRIGHPNVAVLQPNRDALQLTWRCAKCGRSAQIGDPALLLDPVA